MARCAACGNEPGEPCSAIQGALVGLDLGVRYCPLYGTEFVDERERRKKKAVK